MLRNRDLLSVVPACAGVILEGTPDVRVNTGGSRMCGGDPATAGKPTEEFKWFPHVRG